MPLTSLYLPSQGFWHLMIKSTRRTLIRPGVTMRLSCIVRAVSLSEIEGTNSAAPKSRLVVESGGVPTPEGGPQRAIIANLGPMDSVSTHIMLYRGQTYIFEIIGGDVSMYITGQFEPLPSDTLAADTVVLQDEADD